MACNTRCGNCHPEGVNCNYCVNCGKTAEDIRTEKPHTDPLTQKHVQQQDWSQQQRRAYDSRLHSTALAATAMRPSLILWDCTKHVHFGSTDFQLLDCIMNITEVSRIKRARRWVPICLQNLKMKLFWRKDWRKKIRNHTIVQNYCYA